MKANPYFAPSPSTHRARDLPPTTPGKWWGYQDRATGELFAYSRKRLRNLPKTVVLLRWRKLPPEIGMQVMEREKS
jgi:hypothetical protein